MKTTVDTGALVAAVGDAMMVCDAQGLITLWNPAAERMFGHTEAEALGQSLDIIIPQRQQQRHWDGYQQTMKTGVTKYGHDLLKVPALHKDGRTLSIAFTVALIHGADGSVGGIAAVVRDESARFTQDRETRKKIVELEAQLLALQTPTNPKS
ncbi:MAG: PAS domain-containing protein [Rhodoferax sp.]